ncbi:UDP-D-xylose:L-fucose alpha-1,3-D-xylosyltransferase 3 [Holothuria leucospilota]|uniref:UDP-D-xylose:L-fucose alpha-1,3-D-xylosyltransferase 3 n=1 Tax=Holothuria leucospilota TaxID=206669 RepID=A0A9Q0YMM0_HOLLE|nr:UDP-D-xylose:L-fucose alpha-1,3-D-xylosyltransferase 3 [Holothuria leucospilota]
MNAFTSIQGLLELFTTKMNAIFRLRYRRSTVAYTTAIVLIIVTTYYLTKNEKVNIFGAKLPPFQGKGRIRSEATAKNRTMEDLLPFLTSPVVVTTANYGYLQIVNNFLQSFKKIQVNVSIVIVCEDELLYNHFRERKDVHAVITEFSANITKAQKFRTRKFNEIVNRRIFYILQLIDNGIDTLYLDSDTIWIHNPFPYFDEEYDLFVQQEIFQPYCSGMFYIKATQASLRMISYWHALNKDKYTNQYAYNTAIKYTKGLRVKGLPTDRFVGGEIYFRKTTPWFERKPQPVIVHATWLLGPTEKIKQLKKCGLWFVNASYT